MFARVNMSLRGEGSTMRFIIPSGPLGIGVAVCSLALVIVEPSFLVATTMYLYIAINQLADIAKGRAGA